MGLAWSVLNNSHEDVNGEKLTVRKWWIFGADFSRFTQSFSRFIRDINGEKNISLLMIFLTVSFSRFTPSRNSKGHQMNAARRGAEWTIDWRQFQRVAGREPDFPRSSGISLNFPEFP